MIWLIENKGMLGTEIARQLTEKKIEYVGTDIDVDITSYQALSDFNVLPVDIQNLFIRAFVKGGKNPTERPDTIEWYNALTIMQSNLNTCTVNSKRNPQAKPVVRRSVLHG